MYYDRTISDDFSSLIKKGGQLRWLFDFVKKRDDIDFLIGKNNSKQWISIYRGLSRVLTINKTAARDTIILDGANSYRSIKPKLYGKKSVDKDFQSDLLSLITQVSKDHKFDKYYCSKKEGFFQNEISRRYGIFGDVNTDFVIIDKEVVIGYENQVEKDKSLLPIQNHYKQIQKYISNSNPKRYGSDLTKKSIGNELDFLALDRDGNILLIELKHGTNTSGIYLSPLQIGMYLEIFNNYPTEKLHIAIKKMLEQKQSIGLINPNWKTNEKINTIIPVLIIADYNYKSSAKNKFIEISQIAKDATKDKHFLNNLRTYNFTIEKGLTDW